MRENQTYNLESNYEWVQTLYMLLVPNVAKMATALQIGS